MRALLFDGTDALIRDDYPRPSSVDGEAIIRVLQAGVCGTDLEITRGFMAFRGVLGHEFVGIVEDAPDPAWVGQRVVGEINAACGQCATCRAGRPTHCPHRTTLGIDRRDGVFAEFTRLPLQNLHRVPDEVSDDAAVFVEPLAAAWEILEQIHVRPTDRVALIGAGRLGQLVARVLRLVGCELVVWARYPSQVARLEPLGVEVRMQPDYPPAWADVVIEATGDPSGYAAARTLVRPRGVIVLKSTYHGAVEADLTGAVIHELTLVGSRCGPFPPALRALASGLVDVESLIDARYPLAEGLAALERAGQPGTMKVLLEIG
ncbi:MAG: alcohol dehydrogenase catalytic domain-containing protein [Anaerolineae bacterium]